MVSLDADHSHEPGAHQWRRWAIHAHTRAPPEKNRAATLDGLFRFYYALTVTPWAAFGNPLNEFAQRYTAGRCGLLATLTRQPRLNMSSRLPYVA